MIMLVYNDLKMRLKKQVSFCRMDSTGRYLVSDVVFSLRGIQRLKVAIKIKMLSVGNPANVQIRVEYINTRHSFIFAYIHPESGC